MEWVRWVAKTKVSGYGEKENSPDKPDFRRRSP